MWLLRDEAIQYWLELTGRSILEHTLRHWAKDCLPLGRPLKTKRATGLPSRYSKADLEKLASKIIFLSGEEYTDSSRKLWFTDRSARENFGFYKVELAGWQNQKKKPFPPGLNRALLAKQKWVWREGGNLSHTWLYLSTDLETIFEARTGDTTTGLTLEEVFQKYGFGEGCLYSWRTKGHAALGKDKKLRSWKERRQHKGKFRPMLVFNDEDLQKIAAADAEWIPGGIAEDDLELFEGTIRRWFRNEYCPPLGRKGRISKRWATNERGYVRQMVHIHMDEIPLIKKALKGEIETTDWNTAQEGYEEYGLPPQKSREHVNRVSVVLGRVIRSRWERRKVEKSKGDCVQKVRLFHPDDQKELAIAGGFLKIDESKMNGKATATSHKRGAKRKIERDAHVISYAKENGLLDKPTQVTNDLNADEDFVRRYKKLKGGAVRGIFNRYRTRNKRSKRRAQIS